MWKITFDKKLKDTLVTFFVPDLNLLSCVLHKITFKLSH